MPTSSTEIKRCTRCVLSENFSNITFDENGVCSVCFEWDKQWANQDYGRSEKELEILIDDLKSKGKKYDCLVGFSGGKDSIFALLLLRKKYGLNPLAVNFANHFQSDIALEWIDRITQKLGVDLFTFSPERDNYLRLTKEGFRRTGNPCIVCNLGIYSSCERAAIEHDIDTVFFGGGSKFESRLISDHPHLDFYRYVRSIFAFDQEIDLDFSEFEIDEKLSSRYRLIYIGDYLSGWNHERMIEIMEKELSIRFDSEDYIHMDCKAFPVQAYISYHKYGMLKNENTYASLVRDKQWTREEALGKIRDEIEALEANDPDFLDEYLRMLVLSRSEFEETLNSEVRYRPPWYHGEESD